MTKSKKDKKKSGKAEWQGFLNFNLGKTDKDNIKALSEVPFDGILSLQTWVEAGYDIKIIWDSYADCLALILIGRTDSGDDAGYAVSMRHNDLSVAIVGMTYLRTNFTDDDENWQREHGEDSYDW